MTTAKKAAERSRKAPKSGHGRRYPRGPHEAGALAAVGDRRAVGLAELDYLCAGLKDLEARALADLGGAETVSELRRRVLSIGLAADGFVLALLAEVVDKMKQSRAAGHVPHPSRYEAVHVIATFMDLAARRYKDVGLDRLARRVPSLGDYLAERQGGSAASGDANATASAPSVSPAPDRATGPTTRSNARPSEVKP